MKIILFSSPIPYTDFCEIHQVECIHYVEFLVYNAIVHKVQYCFYCGKCAKEKGDKAPVRTGTMSIEEWTKIFSTDEPEN